MGQIAHGYTDALIAEASFLWEDADADADADEDKMGEYWCRRRAAATIDRKCDRNAIR